MKLKINLNADVAEAMEDGPWEMIKILLMKLIQQI